MLESILTSPYFLWPVSILSAALLFSLAVFIHELGHFLMARCLGLRADVFSIGFGPALWKRTIRGTEVRLSAIPFGGYVSLPQLDPEGMKQIQGDHGEALPPATPWKRILVAVAGPLGNIFLALLCATSIALFAPKEATNSVTEVGYVRLDSAAWKAGLRTGDQILEVNQNPVSSWNGFLTECLLSGGTNDVVQITYEREQTRHTTEAILDTKFSESEEVYTVGGLIPGPLTILIEEVKPDMPAAAVGLQAGDIIQAVNGSKDGIFDYLTTSTSTDPINLTVTRNDHTFDVEVTPVMTTLDNIERPIIGVAISFATIKVFPWMTERGIYAQLKSDASGIFRVLRALTMPEKKGERGRAAKGLGGPLMIFALFIQVIQMGVWISLGFLRLICINLAILNLLPLPVLDGGHVAFALYAMIRRKELSPKIIGFITTAFSYLLIGVMIWFLFADVRRFILKLFID